ncbi:unnamed protein product [Rangifer tarandus platyrhynchus]|uniref:Uncharacterized protein n=1 Tax=Rangifer tarandus platyrhynchus TaxID=3082113 RepID=A0ABN8YGA5_RANTA|nr:unnamed protein product [Rangifer tarandus platyrhynchus]
MRTMKHSRRKSSCSNLLAPPGTKRCIRFVNSPEIAGKDGWRTSGIGSGGRQRQPSLKQNSRPLIAFFQAWVGEATINCENILQEYWEGRGAWPVVLLKSNVTDWL